MESDKAAIDLLVGTLMEQAEAEFSNSKEGQLLQEKRQRMDKDTEGFFTGDEWDYIQETYKDLLYFERRKQEYLYKRGIQDCAILLRQMGILA